MKRFFFNKDGTVSIYLILIIVPIFLFHAVLIDFVRIKLAERETENAVKAGARSILAEYDKGLREYGLFGRKDDEMAMSNSFSSVVSGNLSGDNGLESFRYIDTKLIPEETKVQAIYSLANHKIFESQILEDMKYRAPVEFVTEIFAKVKKNKAADQVDSASQVIDHAESLQKKWLEVNEKLDDAWDEALQLCQEASSFKSNYSSKLEQLHALADVFGLNTLEQLQASLKSIEDSLVSLVKTTDDLHRSIQSAETSLSQLRSSANDTTDAVKELETRINSLESSLNQANAEKTKLQDQKVNVAKMLEAIIEYAALLAETKEQIGPDAKKVYDRYTSFSGKLDQAKAANQELIEERDKLLSQTTDGTAAGDKAIYNAVVPWDDTFFSEYKTATGEIASMASGIASYWNGLGLLAGEAYTAAANRLNEYAAKIESYKTQRQDVENKRKAKLKDLENKEDSKKKEISGVLDKVNQASGDQCRFSGSGDAYSASYKQLNGDPLSGKTGLYQKYFRLNSGDNAVIGTEGAAVSGSPMETAKQAMSFGSRIGKLAEDLRNEMYTNEYALARFTNRLSTESSFPGHALSGQEAEYILYGFGSCAANRTAAYSETFLLFFAVRIAEELADPKNEVLNVGSPLLVILVAAAEAAGEAFLDTTRIMEGKEVPILRKVQAIKINYKDCLRLFYLLHSNDKRMLSRMQALIELNSELDLTKETVYVQTRAETSVKLWFLPQIAASLGESLMPAKLKTSRYTIAKTVVMSY
ncbi:hypothetical protein [Gorillibacterium massiliense]|uniref:hypothetical protein n=1 Tax=Gorillibacterium massiliense TaxID=1280390 RepID=UPI0004AFA370|nr:hypothetical protein [Gorillibacterium massiliense]